MLFIALGPGEGTVPGPAPTGLGAEAGWLWYRPSGPSFRDLLLLDSSPDAADAFDRVDCCDASSMGAPSGPVVTTHVTPDTLPAPAVAGLTLVVAVPAAVVMMPLSCTMSLSACGACGVLDMGCMGLGACELGVEAGGGMGPGGWPCPMGGPCPS